LMKQAALIMLQHTAKILDLKQSDKKVSYVLFKCLFLYFCGHILFIDEVIYLSFTPVAEFLAGQEC